MNNSRALFIFLLTLYLMCFKSEAQNAASHGCSNKTWERILDIKNQVDRGFGFNCLGELETIETITDQESEAQILCNSLIAEILIGRGEFGQADKVLMDYGLSGVFLSNSFSRQQMKPIISKYRTLYFAQGRLYYILQNYEFAKEFYLLVKDLYILEGDTESIDYLKCLLNLSLTYFFCDDVVMSKLYYDTANELFYSHHQDSDFMRMRLLFNKATILSAFDKEDEVHECFKKIVEIYENEDFDNDETLAYALSDLLTIDNASDDKYVRMAKSFLKGSDVAERKVWIYQAFISRLLTDDNDFGVMFEDYNSVMRHYFNDIFMSFSSFEYEDLWNNESANLLLLSNIIAKNAASSAVSAGIVGKAYDNVVFTKSFPFRRKKMFDRMMDSFSNSPNLQELLNKYHTIRNSWISKDLSDPERNIINMSLMANEKMLINNFPGWGDSLKNSTPGFERIKSALGNKEVAIEFSVTVDSLNEHTQNIKYIAYVLRDDNDYPYPVEVDLGDYFSFTPVFSQITAYRDSLRIKGPQEEHRFNDSIKSVINRLYDDDSSYKQLLLPLEQRGLLKPYDTIFYSPVGDLNKINLSALKTSDGMRIGDRYIMRKVLSTADVIDLKSSEKPILESALIYADIDYNIPPKTMEHLSWLIKENLFYPWTEHLERTSLQVTDEHSKVDKNDKWTLRAGYSRLPNTNQEAIDIKNCLMRKLAPESVLYFNDSLATEEFFRLCNESAPSIIHIATHGFFVESNVDRQLSLLGDRKGYTKKSKDMFYNALLLAGANNKLNNNDINPNVDDGILTAEEISWMDLRDCKLVVLSACETGLGSVDFVEGVLGLQRGFKLAGVDKIVMSLWRVDDNATRILMTEFYNNLTNGYTTHDALENAKKTLIDSGIYSAPYYWAGFVLLE